MTPPFMADSSLPEWLQKGFAIVIEDDWDGAKVAVYHENFDGIARVARKNGDGPWLSTRLASMTEVARYDALFLRECKIGIFFWP